MFAIYWSLRGFDLVGIGLGVAGIAISIGIFIKQTRTSNNLERLRLATISMSIGRIDSSLEVIRESVESTMELVEIKGGMEWEERIALAKTMLKNENKFYLQVIENITKEIGFLKGQIDPFILTQVEWILDRVKKFSNEILSIDYGGIANTLQAWSDVGNELIKTIKDTTVEIEKLQKQHVKHKNRFKAKGSQ
ncbi:MAG: hypothetical protein KGH86_06965 [Thaumarchaeota archaeon]|nr:hypothetical protein [Nitrososphaerota archaeon]